MSERFGRWDLLEPLARGGMGETFLAQSRGGRRAVIKRVRPGLASPLVLERFEIERRALERLRLDGVPRLLTAGELDGVRYLALEYVDGVDVAQHLAANQAALEERYACASTCAELLGEVHAQRVVHGDLKPTNLLVDRAGHVHIIDFGLSRLLDEPPRLGADAKLMTPRYAAPEQFLGQAITPATDVYALGLVALELVIGRPVHALELAFDELESAALAADVAALTPCGPEVDAAIARAVRMAPAERWPDARQFAAALRAAIGG